jgi:hypothetical protein
MSHPRTINGEGALIVEGIPRGAVTYVLNVSEEEGAEVARGILRFEGGLNAAMEASGPIVVHTAEGSELKLVALSWAPDQNEADVKVDGPIPDL